MASKVKFEDLKSLEKALDKYFKSCDEEGTLYDEAGLALSLGVELATLHSWYDGIRRPELGPAVRMAYLRIQHQIETHPAYMDKTMGTRAIFLLKQKRYGGKQDKIEAKNDINVNVKMGEGMEESDFR